MCVCVCVPSSFEATLTPALSTSSAAPAAILSVGAMHPGNADYILETRMVPGGTLGMAPASRKGTDG